MRPATITPEPHASPATRETAPPRELRGVVERVTYANPENAYAVVRLAPERAGAEAEAARGADRLVTVVGPLAEVQPGEAVVARGWWRNTTKFGWQFQAAEYRTSLPATVQGMKKYLGSGLVKGIGPVMAARIVDAFGEATFDVVDAAPQALTEVPGIGPVRAGRIAATWAEQRQVREVMTVLQSHGVSTSLAVRIYKKFGDDSVRVIGKEPYRLARDVWGMLANQLVKAVSPGAHLLLVGDPDQLPSVGAGDVLADLLRADRFPVTRLRQIFRQGAGSGIAADAARVNRGEMPVFDPAPEDCFFLPAGDPAAAAELVTDHVARRLPARYGFRPGEVQVLAPMLRGAAGVGALNLLLQERLNPPRDGAPEVRSGGWAFRSGDRVLELKNDYDLQVYNGDLGTVRAV